MLTKHLLPLSYAPSYQAFFWSVSTKEIMSFTYNLKVISEKFKNSYNGKELNTV